MSRFRIFQTPVNQSIIDDEDKAKVTIYCRAKDKTYYWGQCIPCEYKK